MSAEGMGASMVVEGSTTKAVFETYAERVLAPVLTPGQVVVMDNLSSHKGSRVRELWSRVEAASFCTCRPTPRRTIEPHRGSVRQDKGAAKEGRGTHPRGAHRSDGLGA
jgi:transposase